MSLLACKQGAGSYKTADALNDGVIASLATQDIKAIEAMFPDKELYRALLTMSPELKTPEAVEAAMGSYDSYYQRVLQGVEQEFQSAAYKAIDWSSAKYEGMLDEEEIKRPQVPEVIKLKSRAVFNTSSGKYAIPMDAFVYKNNWYLNKLGSASAL